jgi:hypothetical protein
MLSDPSTLMLPAHFQVRGARMESPVAPVANTARREVSSGAAVTTRVEPTIRSVPSLSPDVTAHVPPAIDER